jgi:hypothetical protein
MNKRLESSVAPDQGDSGTKHQKQALRSKGKRLLWLLLIPALLACCAFVTAHARRTSNASLAETTNTLALQNVSVVHPELGGSVNRTFAVGHS